MNVKELAELLKEKKYTEFYFEVEKISPRVLRYIFDYVDYGATQDDMIENTSKEKFQRWRSLLAGETETDYLIKKETEYIKKGLKDFCVLYELTDEEKRQACLL